jgi:hypothetical protein
MNDEWLAFLYRKMEKLTGFIEAQQETAREEADEVLAGAEPAARYGEEAPPDASIAEGDVPEEAFLHLWLPRRLWWWRLRALLRLSLAIVLPMALAVVLLVSWLCVVVIVVGVGPLKPTDVRLILDSFIFSTSIVLPLVVLLAAGRGAVRVLGIRHRTRRARRASLAREDETVIKPDAWTSERWRLIRKLVGDESALYNIGAKWASFTLVSWHKVKALLALGTNGAVDVVAFMMRNGGCIAISQLAESLPAGTDAARIAEGLSAVPHIRLVPEEDPQALIFSDGFLKTLYDRMRELIKRADASARENDACATD